MRQRYWVVKARLISRKTVPNCIACLRQLSVLAHQLMGSPPGNMVGNGMHSFESTSIDFSGPRWMHLNQRCRRPREIASVCSRVFPYKGLLPEASFGSQRQCLYVS